MMGDPEYVQVYVVEQREEARCFWAGGARWVKKASDAVWFARKADALVVGSTLGMFRYYVEEHIFAVEPL